MSPEEVRQFIAVLKKYPKQYHRCEDYVKRVHKNLKELSDMF